MGRTNNDLYDNSVEPPPAPQAARGVDSGVLDAEQLQQRLARERRVSDLDKRATIEILAVNLAHRLATPLNVIRGRAEHLLRREPNPPKTVQALETIVNQIDKITETIKTLLELEAPREAIREPHDVREIVRSSAILMQPIAGERRINFTLELGDAPLPVRCDPEQLRLVFMNLIHSAVDSAGEQGGALKIAARPGGDGQAAIRVSVQDPGGRLAPDVGSRFFDPFSAAKEMRTAAIRLAVAQWIAREHDGDITREGADGFVVNLPAAMLEPGGGLS